MIWGPTTDHLKKNIIKRSAQMLQRTTPNPTVVNAAIDNEMKTLRLNPYMAITLSERVPCVKVRGGNKGMIVNPQPMKNS
jgi:hypothetical protein